jgi:hypothetical protein
MAKGFYSKFGEDQVQAITEDQGHDKSYCFFCLPHISGVVISKNNWN